MKVANKECWVFSFIVFQHDRIKSNLHFKCHLGERGGGQKGPHFVVLQYTLLAFSRQQEAFVETLFNEMHSKGLQISAPFHDRWHPT